MCSICIIEYYSSIKRNKIGLLVVMWIDQESVIQSEVSQKEKNKYHILMDIYGIQKNGMGEPICREGIEMQTEACGCRGKEEGETNWGVALTTMLCSKQIASGKLLGNTESSACCSRGVGWRGWEGG